MAGTRVHAWQRDAKKVAGLAIAPRLGYCLDGGAKLHEESTRFCATRQRTRLPFLPLPQLAGILGRPLVGTGRRPLGFPLLTHQLGLLLLLRRALRRRVRSTGSRRHVLGVGVPILLHRVILLVGNLRLLRLERGLYLHRLLLLLVIMLVAHRLGSERLNQQLLDLLLRAHDERALGVLVAHPLERHQVVATGLAVAVQHAVVRALDDVALGEDAIGQVGLLALEEHVECHLPALVVGALADAAGRNGAADAQERALDVRVDRRAIRRVVATQVVADLEQAEVEAAAAKLVDDEQADAAVEVILVDALALARGLARVHVLDRRGREAVVRQLGGGVAALLPARASSRLQHRGGLLRDPLDEWVGVVAAARRRAVGDAREGDELAVGQLRLLALADEGVEVDLRLVLPLELVGADLAALQGIERLHVGALDLALEEDAVLIRAVLHHLDGADGARVQRVAIRELGQAAHGRARRLGRLVTKHLLGWRAGEVDDERPIEEACDVDPAVVDAAVRARVLRRDALDRGALVALVPEDGTEVARLDVVVVELGAQLLHSARHDAGVMVLDRVEMAVHDVGVLGVLLHLQLAEFRELAQPAVRALKRQAGVLASPLVLLGVGGEEGMQALLERLVHLRLLAAEDEEARDRLERGEHVVGHAVLRFEVLVHLLVEGGDHAHRERLARARDEVAVSAGVGHPRRLGNSDHILARRVGGDAKELEDNVLDGRGEGARPGLEVAKDEALIRAEGHVLHRHALLLGELLQNLRAGLADDADHVVRDLRTRLRVVTGPVAARRDHSLALDLDHRRRPRLHIVHVSHAALHIALLTRLTVPVALHTRVGLTVALTVALTIARRKGLVFEARNLLAGVHERSRHRCKHELPVARSGRSDMCCQPATAGSHARSEVVKLGVREVEVRVKLLNAHGVDVLDRGNRLRHALRATTTQSKQKRKRIAGNGDIRALGSMEGDAEAGWAGRNMRSNAAPRRLPNHIPAKRVA